ncbi:MAG TPA: hypothetical protein VFJ30_18300 [Phycisphaerae bacterium]|nr:hypothetical protein [Phycisphaerae bacterium]
MKNLAAVIVCVLDVLEAMGRKRRSLIAWRLIALSSGAILIVTAMAFGLAAVFLAISKPLGAALGALLTAAACLLAAGAAMVALRSLGRRG